MTTLHYRTYLAEPEDAACLGADPFEFNRRIVAGLEDTGLEPEFLAPTRVPGQPLLVEDASDIGALAEIAKPQMLWPGRLAA